jgi:hypothetical protein
MLELQLSCERRFPGTGQADHDEEGRRIHGPCTELRTPHPIEPMSRAAHLGRSVLLAFRPEDVHDAAVVGILLAHMDRSGGRAGLWVGERTLPLWGGLPVELEPSVDFG